MKYWLLACLAFGVCSLGFSQVIYESADENERLTVNLASKSTLVGYYKKVSGPSWLSVDSDGIATGIPRKINEGTNRFHIVCQQLGGQADIDLEVDVYCSG